MITLTSIEQQIADILVEAAKCGRTVTFKEIMQRVGVGRRKLGEYLSHIGKKCQDLGLPIVTVLVVYTGSGKVGIGYDEFDATFPYDTTKAKEEQNKVWGTPSWEGLSNTVQEYDGIWTNDVVGEEGETVYAKRKTIVRDGRLRERCLREKGYVCAVCGFDATKKYGKAFAGLIEVHHLSPMAEGVRKTTLDDLLPVCPNCHRALHSKAGEPYTVEELKKILK